MTAKEILDIKLPDLAVTLVQRKLALAEAEQQILSYCGLEEVPEALYFTQANMAADLLRYKPDEETSGPVSSISEGDTSVSFAQQKPREWLDALLLNYREQLQEYRKVRW